MKSIKKMILLGFMITGSFQAQAEQVSPPVEASQSGDRSAYDIILAMQECINSNQMHLQMKKYLDNQSTFRPVDKNLDDLLATQEKFNIGMNENKALFAKLISEYIVNFGQLYETEGNLFNLYNSSYYISSVDDKNLPITPHEYNLLVEVLENAAEQVNWKQEKLLLSLPFTQGDNSTILRVLNLREVITGITNIPLSLIESHINFIKKHKDHLTSAAAVGLYAVSIYNMPYWIKYLNDQNMKYLEGESSIFN